MPVLLEASVDGLNIKESGVYVDLTFGGGGHSSEILKRLNTGKLYAFDQDPDAEKNAIHLEDERFTFVPANFRFLKRYLRLYGITHVDGILADLGVSSHQFDEVERGFSFRGDSALDMRMDQHSELTAAKVLTSYNEKDLQNMFSAYGEVRNARNLSQAIVKQRVIQPINTTGELLEILKQVAPKGKEMKYFAQVFQALRIEVNDEIAVVEDMLKQSADVLSEGGRLVVISYHSLEDRLVKNYMQKGALKGDAEKDLYGNDLKPFDIINRKPIVPDEDEVGQNSRARSAKLRIAKRNNWHE